MFRAWRQIRGSHAALRRTDRARTLALEALEDRAMLSFLTPVSRVVSGLPRSVAVADLNRDGPLDLVVVNSDANTVCVLLGSGGGAFNAPVFYPAGNDPGFVAVGGLNGDGCPGLAVASNLSKSVSVLLGNGDGTFGSGISS